MLVRSNVDIDILKLNNNPWRKSDEINTIEEVGICDILFLVKIGEFLLEFFQSSQVIMKTFKFAYAKCDLLF